MSSATSVTLAPAAQPRLVMNILRAESVALLSIAAYAAFAPQSPTLVALPLILLALFMHPARPRSVANIRAERRSLFLASLASEAQGLRERYLKLSRLPLSQSRSQECWQLQRQVASWIASAESQFRPYPEFKAIFEAHQAPGNVIDELDACISRLGQLRRLTALSRKHKLPI